LGGDGIDVGGGLLVGYIGGDGIDVDDDVGIIEGTLGGG